MTSTRPRTRAPVGASLGAACLLALGAGAAAQTTSPLPWAVVDSAAGLALTTTQPSAPSTTLRTRGGELRLNAAADLTAPAVYRAGGLSVEVTSLPVFDLRFDGPLGLDPEVHGALTYLEPGGRVERFEVGAELLDARSVGHAKPSLDVELWADPSGGEHVDGSFAGLRFDDDWVLDALHEDPTMLRGHLAHNLWVATHRPYFAADDPEARAGARSRLVEVVIDGTYRGVYALRERVDRMQLGVRKPTGDSLLGTLVRVRDTARFVMLDTLPEREITAGLYDWKYPKRADAWAGLRELHAALARADTADLPGVALRRLLRENLVDHFLFANLVALDGGGARDLLVARYSLGEPYFVGPWEPSFAFGLDGEGRERPPADTVYLPPLFARLLDDEAFLAEARARYLELRRGVWSEQRLRARYREGVEALRASGAYRRESAARGRRAGAGAAEEARGRFDTFVRARLDALDVYLSGG